MKCLIGAIMASVLLTACATAPEIESKAVVTVQEVAYTPPDPVPVSTGEYLYIPSNFRQLICRSQGSAAAVENVGLASRIELEARRITQLEHTERYADAVYVLVAGLRSSGECRARTGEEPAG